MALDELKENDETVKSGNFTFVMEDFLTENYGAFTIDYSDSWLRKGFTVIPDRNASSC